MNKELEKYIGKEVKIVLKTGETFIGKVDDTSDAEDNERPFKTIEIWIKIMEEDFFMKMK